MATKAKKVSWKKPSNFAALKAKVHSRVKRLREPTETAALAAEMHTDARYVRWACRELAREGAGVKLKRNARNRAVVARG